MKINWDIKNPVRQGWFKRVFGHKPAPLHMSNHYKKEHFK